MPLVITPYNELDNNMQGTPTIGGTWSYVGTGSTGAPPLPPNPPATYNGTLDFAGVTPGSYEYQYTVAPGLCKAGHSAILTINKYNYSPVANDTCSSAYNIAFPYSGGTNSRKEETNNQTCPGQAYPTDSGVSIPTQWGSGPFQGDMWYKVNYVSTIPTSTPLSMTIEIDGTPYTDHITQPLLAVYSNCSAIPTLVDAASTSNNKVSLTFDSIFASNFTYYIRVACITGNEGKFDVNIIVS